MACGEPYKDRKLFIIRFASCQNISKKNFEPKATTTKKDSTTKLGETDGNREHFHGDAEFMFFNLTVFVLACILFMEANGEYVMHQIELHIGAGLALADGGHHQMHCRGVFKVFTTKSLFRPTGIIKTNQSVAFGAITCIYLSRISSRDVGYFFRFSLQSLVNKCTGSLKRIS